MKKTQINIIAAIGKNRVLGKDNSLLWKIPDDLRRFKALTMGHPILMGRKTYESIGKALPGRTTIVITKNKDFIAPDCVIKNTIKEAIQYASSIDPDDIFICGGGQIYTETISIADKIHLTIIDKTEEGDTFFPPYEEMFTETKKGQKMIFENIPYTFIDLVKKQKSA